MVFLYIFPVSKHPKVSLVEQRTSEGIKVGPFSFDGVESDYPKFTIDDQFCRGKACVTILSPLNNNFSLSEL